MTGKIEANIVNKKGHNKNVTAKEAILDPKRLDALDACDTPVYHYHRYGLLRDFQHCRGRNFGMLALPLLMLLLWGIIWQLVFLYADVGDELKEAIVSWWDLLSPLWIPISFLMVFRLARAAIRFWDSRAAMGKIIHTCRDTVSTVSVALNAPRRLMLVDNNMYHIHGDLLDRYARWTSAFPIALKNFLRPRMDIQKKEYLDEDILMNEIGLLLEEDEAHMITASTRHQVIVVLDRLRQLAYDICFTVDLKLHPTAAAEVYKQLNTHLDTLSGAFGAMERICGTPLPFVYVAHLRTFLLLYLLLFNLYCIATDGWPALLILFAINWAMLGLEAASVECERPFGWSPNHLPLGKFCIVIGQNIVQTLDETNSVTMVSQ